MRISDWNSDVCSSYPAGKRTVDHETSLCVQPYPVANHSAIDEQAEGQVAELKAQVEAVRALRGEMSLSPAQRVPLIAQGDKNVLAVNAMYLTALAKLDGVDIVDTRSEEHTSELKSLMRISYAVF